MMKSGKSNDQLLKHIISYADQIDEANRMFNADKNELENNSVYRNSVALCLLQIGELANKLTDDYKESTADQIPWKAVRGLRNIVAHEYGHIDCESLWETIQTDVPVLREFCKREIVSFEEIKEKSLEDDKQYEDLIETEEMDFEMTME